MDETLAVNVAELYVSRFSVATNAYRAKLYSHVIGQ